MKHQIFFWQSEKIVEMAYATAQTAWTLLLKRDYAGVVDRLKSIPANQTHLAEIFSSGQYHNCSIGEFCQIAIALVWAENSDYNTLASSLLNFFKRTPTERINLLSTITRRVIHIFLKKNSMTHPPPKKKSMFVFIVIDEIDNLNFIKKLGP